MSEHNLQRHVFKWLQLQHPKLYAAAYSVPNGAKRSARLAAYMKAEGMKPGVPDICIAYPSNGFHGLYIELKIKKNRPTINQMEWLERLNDNGYLAAWLNNFEDVVETINKYAWVKND